MVVAVTALSAPCTIMGYPTVKLVASDNANPFTYVHGKGAYVTPAAPRPVTVGRGRLAYFLIAKYRCDAGFTDVATGLNIDLPGQGTTLSAPLTWALGTFAVCAGGATDPGNIVSVSPFEPAVAQLHA